MRWNNPDTWVWSTQIVHDPLISEQGFFRVRELMAGRHQHLDTVTTPRRSRHPYQLSGLLFCGLCGRRMQGSWNNDKPHYRCVYPTEYAQTNHTPHPRSTYLREEQVVPALDRWLRTAFSPAHLADTIQELANAQDHHVDEQLHAQAAEARRIITDCDQRLARYRAALEAGTDPTLIATWTAEVNIERAAAQARLRATTGTSPRLTPQEIADIVNSLGNIPQVLRDAEQAAPILTACPGGPADRPDIPTHRKAAFEPLRLPHSERLAAARQEQAHGW